MRRARHLAALAAAALLASTLIFGCVAPGDGPNKEAAASPAFELIAPQPLRPGRARPIVAVIGENYFTELSDYIVPYGVLAESGVAEVIALATKPGPIQMFPARLKIEPHATSADFDARFPGGADYVIVPAVHRAEDPALIGWVQAQAAKGARIVGVCDGVWVVANAGLLKGRRAVGHWYSAGALQRKFPETRWEKNRRYVADGNVITTTGAAASIPVSLALVEAIGGRERALAVAKSLGVADWSPEHRSDDFYLNAGHIFTAARNLLAFWSHEKIGVPVSPGSDEIALALAADAYSRTYRSRAYFVSSSNASIKTRRGLVFLPDGVLGVSAAPDRTLPALDGMSAPAAALDAALKGIERSYGEATAAFVALQLEAPRP
jgi:putative intracellular protease/amidase